MWCVWFLCVVSLVVGQSSLLVLSFVFFVVLFFVSSRAVEILPVSICRRWRRQRNPADGLAYSQETTAVNLLSRKAASRTRHKIRLRRHQTYVFFSGVGVGLGEGRWVWVWVWRWWKWACLLCRKSCFLVVSLVLSCRASSVRLSFCPPCGHAPVCKFQKPQVQIQNGPCLPDTSRCRVRACRRPARARVGVSLSSRAESRSRSVQVDFTSLPRQNNGGPCRLSSCRLCHSFFIYFKCFNQFS